MCCKCIKQFFAFIDLYIFGKKALSLGLKNKKIILFRSLNYIKIRVFKIKLWRDVKSVILCALYADIYISFFVNIVLG